MKFLGIWPEKRRFNRLSSYVVLMPLGMMIVFINIPQTFDLYYIWGDLNSMVENLSIGNMVVFISVLKTIIFWFNGESIRPLLKSMEQDRKEASTEEEVKRMMRIAKICRRLSAALILTYYTLLLILIILQILLVYIAGRVLILRSYFPYNFQKTPNYQLTIVAQMTAAYFTGGTYTGVDTFVVTLVLHACGQYENLEQRLRNVCIKTDDDFQTKLTQIVKKHNALNRFVETIEEQFNDMLLLQMLCCTILLCVTCFLATSSIGGNNNMMSVQLAFFMVYLTYILLQMYMYCYIGERLLSEGIGIIDAIYECKWYTLPPNEAKSLMIIMLRAKIPLQITAGKFCQFSHNLFSSILKTSMSYLSLLHAMNVGNAE
ncbi:PREDICTED: odorant receptor 13a-like [Polistes dominula]|uniref:Odorant receptor n=1 Tax=Polistes dominula TaxID=743375 RepID=A0ABM1IM03_POLDO|nr:PREDICTED: odorant receptor 13a-like [Polistes dominula]